MLLCVGLAFVQQQTCTICAFCSNKCQKHYLLNLKHKIGLKTKLKTRQDFGKLFTEICHGVRKVADRKQASVVHCSTQASRSVGGHRGSRLAGICTLALPPAQALLPPPPHSRCTHTPSHLKDKAKRNRTAQILTDARVDKHSQSQNDQNQDATCENGMGRRVADLPSKVRNSELATLPTEVLVILH